ncbi:protein crumbs homolog 3a [Latimeria chalumnae]|uniref:protein crumbs homolog 3a n=1 Tax=Latimeria chalumnae TaxID=7897 RepID=UPI0003C10567|nr:PREDICTED: protein crumbs homolog 3 [Latimeria chalumnae]XP_014351656.1 PREDICTED: protein crumbs homolog 3 [Latimeria chalumnae]|eukprot:XP_006008637.1 PREDICTED: protein crumbs homolog 3 [Latimeria chalumnae]
MELRSLVALSAILLQLVGRTFGQTISPNTTTPMNTTATSTTSPPPQNLAWIAAIIVPCVVVLVVIPILVVVIRKVLEKRRTEGTYRPSNEEQAGKSVQPNNPLKLPPEERLI